MWKQTKQRASFTLFATLVEQNGLSETAVEPTKHPADGIPLYTSTMWYTTWAEEPIGNYRTLSGAYANLS